MLLARLLFALALASASQALQLLVVYPFPARSHNILGNGIVRHLLAAGHQVTYITPFPFTNPHKNLRQVDVSSNIHVLPGDILNIQRYLDGEADFNDEVFQFNSIIQVVENTLNDNNVQTLMNDPKEKFDLIIAEWMFTESYSGLAAVFNCPYIWSIPYETHATPLSLIDEVTNPAYVPYMISKNVPPYSFWQRASELLYQIYSICWLKSIKFPMKERNVYNQVYGPVMAKKGRPLPSFDEMQKSASMMLSNSHVSISNPVSLPQNYKYIGGFHIEDGLKPLPEDLKRIMDNAEHGVIYFSLGSNLKSKDFPPAMIDGLLKMFSEFKQTVIWKFEEERETLPKNVNIIKWGPQQSILSHTNCKLFITHGGLLSTIEAVHFGIPLIGIPVFADQFGNVQRVVSRGLAKRVDLSRALAEDIRVAINEIINDPSYSTRAKEISFIYHDRVVPPGRELVHWVEHVVRTRGAPHLRSPALLVPWYQKMYLDLAAVILAGILVIKNLIKIIMSNLTTSKKNLQKKKKAL